MTDARRYDVIVIGAGPNGLTAAAWLAKSGCRVALLERRDVVGGLAVGAPFHDGYTSGGLHQSAEGLHDDVVEELGLAARGLAARPAPPVLVAQADGPGLLVHHDPTAARAEIAAFSARDAERYAEYRALLDRLGGFIARVLAAAPPRIPTGGLAGLLPLAGDLVALRRLGRADMMELLRIAPMCVADWLNEWFETERLKCALAAPALDASFTGPWSPGTNAVLLRAEALCRGRTWGSPRAVVDALAAAARRAGVDVRVSAPVRAIRVDGGAVRGVTLEDGETLDAAVVGAACDPKTTLLRLVPASGGGASAGAALEHRMRMLRSTGTTAQVNFALRGPPRFAGRPELDVARARTGQTIDGVERAFDAAKYRRCSDAPVLDVAVPTYDDPVLAPDGHHVVSVLAQYAPYDLEGGWSDEARAALGAAVTTELARYVADLETLLVAREVLTPVDIETRYGVTGGHLHHAEHGLDQLLTRPAPECARYATPIEGLYLCGSGSHPGGGPTGLPGLLAGRQMARGRGSRVS